MKDVVECLNIDMFHKASPLPYKKMPKTKLIFQLFKSNFISNP
jgi:hypothetical protein